MDATSTAYSGTSATSIKIISGTGRAAVGGGLKDSPRQAASQAIRTWLRDPVP